MSALSYAQSINPSKSVCQFANTDVHFQPLVPKILTRFYNLLILTYKSMWVAWALQAFRALYDEVGLGWIYAMTNHQPVSPIQEKMPDVIYFMLGILFFALCFCNWERWTSLE
jgi:hypothetical protein